MTDLTTLETRLTEAEAAMHLLATGSQRQSVDIGTGGRVAYTAANVADLRLYIAGLKNQIAKLKGLSRRAPIYVEF
ncbi:MAG: gpW family head-tail joining protein [Alphaproteobacteria bacterium]|jgi:hypothetical protein|nr:gpW family head-tail joining protein [Alphaproteobacteria bacterium]